MFGRGQVFVTLHGFGFRYFKLDFLTVGLKRGGRYDPTLTRVEAYRSALRLIVEAVGPESYVVGCGAPLGPSIGLVDALRISGDVSANWENGSVCYLCGHGVAIPSAKWALQSTLTRSFFQQKWWLNDPDCLLVRPEDWTNFQVQTICTIIGMGGGLCFLSDDLTRLQGTTDQRLAMVRKILPPSTKSFGEVSAAELMQQELPSHFACYPPARTATASGGSTTAVHALINWTDKPKANAATARLGDSRTTAAAAAADPAARAAELGPGGAQGRPGPAGGGGGGGGEIVEMHYFDLWNEALLTAAELEVLRLGGPCRTKEMAQPCLACLRGHLFGCALTTLKRWRSRV